MTQTTTPDEQTTDAPISGFVEGASFPRRRVTAADLDARQREREQDLPVPMPSFRSFGPEPMGAPLPAILPRREPVAVDRFSRHLGEANADPRGWWTSADADRDQEEWVRAMLDADHDKYPRLAAVGALALLILIAGVFWS